MICPNCQKSVNAPNYRQKHPVHKSMQDALTCQWIELIAVCPECNKELK